MPSRPPVVLVTGCSAGGIGYEACRRFAARGCKVYATARTVSKMAGLEALGCVLLPLDVTDEAAISATVGEVLRAEGAIDILVNNAAVGIMGAVTDTPLLAARKLFDTNYFGCVALIQAVAPGMIARRSGTIVNVASIAAYNGTPLASHYCASKAALLLLNDALRVELHPLGVHVMCVLPGYVRTEISNNVQSRGEAFCDPAGPFASLRPFLTRDIFENVPAEPCQRFAQRMADAVLRSRPPTYHRGGHLGVLGPWLALLLPRWVKDYVTASHTGLTALEKALKRAGVE